MNAQDTKAFCANSQPRAAVRQAVRGIRRVIHIVPALFGKTGIVGGAERYALELARAMSAKVDTTLVTFGEQPRTWTEGTLKLRVIGNPWYVRGQLQNPFSFRLLPELLGSDVVHCHQQHLVTSSFAAAVCRLTGRRVFVSELGGGGWDISAYVSTQSWYHGHLHISDYSRRIFGQGSDNRAHVIYGGVDLQKFSPGTSAQRANDFVLYTGRVLPHKGIDYLVQAVPPELQLVILGRLYDTAYADYLKELARGKQVTFLSDCDDESLVDHYRRALCVVLPSVYRTSYGVYSDIPELLGQTLLEGMACAKPVICTDVASMPEVVVDGVTGFVVPPNNPDALRDRLMWLRANEHSAHALGESARERVAKQFSWTTTVDSCMRIYAASN